MIAKYKGQYFCVDLSKVPHDIWRYDFVDGFKKGITTKGNVYYEQQVMPYELEKIFEVGFSVKWHGEWFGVFYSENKELVSFVTYDKELAQQYKMLEIEHGVFEYAIPIDECEAFRLWTKDIKDRKDIYTILSLEEFKEQWKLLRQDLIPPQ